VFPSDTHRLRAGRELMVWTDGGETEFHHRFCEMLYEAKTAEKFNKQIKVRW
jgi:hypothetical protein